MDEPEDRKPVEDDDDGDEGEGFDVSVAQEAADGRSELAYFYGGNDFLWDSSAGSVG